MNLLDIVSGAEFNPTEIDYTQYHLSEAIALSFYMCNAKYLSRINSALGEDALKRLEIKDGSLVSNPEDFDKLIELTNDFMNHIRSQG